MDEGVDPTQMCQSLVAKVAQSKQLRAVAEPGVLALFEEWLEELEREVIDVVASRPNADPIEVARELGLNENGALFLVAKLTREGKVTPSPPGGRTRPRR